MKKIGLGTLVLLSTITLIACGKDNSDKSIEKTGNATVESKSEKVKKGPLLKVGEYANDDIFGKLTLKKIASIDKEFEILDGLSVKINDVKAFHAEGIDDLMQQQVKQVFPDVTENLDYLQIAYDVENKTDEEIKNIKIEKIVLGDKSQLETDFTFNWIDVKPEARLNDQTTLFALKNTNVDSLKIYFSATDKDGYNLDEAKVIDIKF